MGKDFTENLIIIRLFDLRWNFAPSNLRPSDTALISQPPVPAFSVTAIFIFVSILSASVERAETLSKGRLTGKKYYEIKYFYLSSWDYTYVYVYSAWPVEIVLILPTELFTYRILLTNVAMTHLLVFNVILISVKSFHCSYSKESVLAILDRLR